MVVATEAGMPCCMIRSFQLGGCPLAPPLAACVHALGMPGMTEAPLSAPRLPVPPLPFNHLGVGSPEGAGGAWQCLSCF